MILKKMIAEIEEKTGIAFDLKNPRQFMQLNGKIERLHQNELRQLNLINKALNSTNENELFCSSTHFINTKRGSK